MERKITLLSQQEIDLEKGVGADPKQVKKQADIISDNWKIPDSKPEKPFVLLLGGFQGSGKTTVLKILAPKLKLVVISPDEIRHNLFAQNYPFSEDFVRLVHAVKFDLTKRALELGLSFAIDQTLNPDRVRLIKELAAAYPKFSVKSVFFNSPTELLKNRVRRRVKIDKLYNGTVPELEASIKKYTNLYGLPNKKDYDLFIDTSSQTPESVTEFITKNLSS